jgi:hypothetical protein
MITSRFDRKYDSSGFFKVMLCTYYAPSHHSISESRGGFNPKRGWNYSLPVGRYYNIFMESLLNASHVACPVSRFLSMNKLFVIITLKGNTASTVIDTVGP